MLLVAIAIGTASAFIQPPLHHPTDSFFVGSTRRLAQIVARADDDSCLVEEPLVECAVRKQVDGLWADSWAKYVLLRPGMSFGELKAATLKRNQLDPRCHAIRQWRPTPLFN